MPSTFLPGILFGVRSGWLQLPQPNCPHEYPGIVCLWQLIVWQTLSTGNKVITLPWRHRRVRDPCGNFLIHPAVTGAAGRRKQPWRVARQCNWHDCIQTRYHPGGWRCSWTLRTKGQAGGVAWQGKVCYGRSGFGRIVTTAWDNGHLLPARSNPKYARSQRPAPAASRNTTGTGQPREIAPGAVGQQEMTSGLVENAGYPCA